ncbi:NTP/NDP exchange transporter [Neorhodopirellula lusitana]|uniref:NTP/NDP exchange transporter n=1 Tax=Neorhodopirellula lusitana TaxID=445327 RepID=UPI00384C66A6
MNHEADTEFANDTNPAGIRGWLETRLPATDRAGVGWATAWFFCLLFGYYHLRPLREAKGFANGSDEIPWLFLGSFLIMLLAVPVYGTVVNRGRGIGLVHRVYGFFAVNLLVFFVAMRIEDPAIAVWVGRVYFVWLSVFNLFVISLMWTVLADCFRSGQAKRYFGWISAGGTLGGIAGSEVANRMSDTVHLSFVPLIAAGLLVLCQYCATRFVQAIAGNAADADTASDATTRNLPSPDDDTNREKDSNNESDQAGTDTRTKTSIWAGVQAVFTSPYLTGIFAFLIVIQACGTTIYCQQGDFIRAAGLDEANRFALLSRINFWVLACTLIVQFFGTATIVRKLGLAWVLTLFPAIYVVGFVMLATIPSLAVIVGLVIVHRAAAYAIISPSIQVLYTVVDKRVLYKVKSFLDTAVVRGGDLFSAQAFGALRGWGWSLAAIAIGFVPLAALTCLIGNWVGRRQQRLGKER